MKPIAPTLTGRFFEYPSDATGSVLPYWLAAGGTVVRMTPACKKAFCATIEACIERATAIANAENSFVGNQYALADWGKSQADNFSAIDLGKWALASERESISASFCRGCPKKHMDQMVSAVWDLWTSVNPYSVDINQKTANVYAWQTEFWAQQDGDIWQEDDAHVPIEITWSFSVGQTPCDSSWTQTGRQMYAPWGEYKGPRYPEPNGIMNWLSGELVKLDRQNIYVPLSVFFQPSMQEILEVGTQNPEVLGYLDDGKLGNWISVDMPYAGQSTTRRSSSEWGVLQSMLANMQYTSLTYDYVGTYKLSSATREHNREWAMDPVTFDISCYELPLSADEYTFSTDQNYLESRSNVDKDHYGALYDIKFFIPEDDYETLVLNSRPMYGLADFQNAKDYAIEIREEGSEGPGKSTVRFNKSKTYELVDVQSNVPSPYPAQPFEGYIEQRGNVTCVDSRKLYDPNGDGMEDYTMYHRTRSEQPNTDLVVPVSAHCAQLLNNELSAPRNFPDPGPIGNVQQYDRDWWGEWQLYYPEQPNWPPDDPYPTQYAPYQIVSPGDVGRCDVLEYDPSTYGYPTDWGGITFGTFELAFPNYPFGWGNVQHVELRCSGGALAQYKWQFKAMPAGGSPI